LKTWLAYGKTGINVDLTNDYDIHVLSPTFVKGLTDPETALRDALRDPISATALRDIIKPGNKVGIVFSDITRPTPNTIILPTILTELDHISPDNIVLFVALGTHRQNTTVELRDLVGDDLFEKYRIVQNDSFNRSTQIKIGQTSRGHDIWLNHELLSCDVKILTGFIEPHLFAGYSGGGKAIMPGMAGQETVLGNHDAGLISNPKAVWGVTNGNPIWEEIHEVTDKIKGTFLVNVALNKEKKITAVFAGKLREAHKKGCEFVRKNAMVVVDQPFDIVITSNSGYPLDLNLYQAIKGVSAASQVVKEGGSIIIVAECWDGIPDHGLYRELLREVNSPGELLDKIIRSSKTQQDQWQAQIQAQIQLKADVYVYSENLDDEQIVNAMMKPCRDIKKSVIELGLKYGRTTRICILPEGPQTVPYIQGKKY
jgi:nickel-dependent lactate racemase